MSFLTISDGIITTITKHANYGSTNVYADDHRHLGAGQLRYIVVGFGGYTREELTFQSVAHNWVVTLDVYSRYTGQLSTTNINAHTDVQAIVDTLEAWPKLSDTTGVNNFEIAGISPIEPQDPDNHAGYVKQVVSLAVQEVVCPTRSE